MHNNKNVVFGEQRWRVYISSPVSWCNVWKLMSDKRWKMVKVSEDLEVFLCRFKHLKIIFFSPFLTCFIFFFPWFALAEAFCGEQNVSNIPRLCVKYKSYLRQRVMALKSDPQTAAWRQRTYQKTWWRQRTNQRLESAWQAHCRDTIVIVRNHEK